MSISDPHALAFFLGDAFRSTAGVHVTTETALGVPAVWSAVNFLSDTIASLPLHAFQNTKDSSERLAGDPLAKLLHDSVNPELTSYQWRKWLMSVVLTTGRSITFIDRAQSGRVLDLYPVHPGDVTIERVNGQVQYRVTATTMNGASTTIYDSRDVIDIKFMADPDLVGHRSPVHLLRNSLGLAIALEEYASRFFQNGGVPPLQLTGPFQSPQGAERASFDIGNALKAVKAKGGNVLPLPIGHELKAIGFSPEQGQLIEARKFALTEIARIYGLPPTFIQDLERATFSNAEQSDLHFVKHTVSHWVTAIEQELNLKLFGRGSDKFCKFNLDGLLRRDYNSRMAGHSTSVQNGICTPNEVRKLEDLPPIPNADKLMIQGATVPLENAGKKPEPAPVAAPVEPTEDSIDGE